MDKRALKKMIAGLMLSAAVAAASGPAPAWAEAAAAEEPSESAAYMQIRSGSDKVRFSIRNVSEIGEEDLVKILLFTKADNNRNENIYVEETGEDFSTAEGKAEGLLSQRSNDSGLYYSGDIDYSSSAIVYGEAFLGSQDGTWTRIAPISTNDPKSVGNETGCTVITRKKSSDSGNQNVSSNREVSIQRNYILESDDVALTADEAGYYIRVDDDTDVIIYRLEDAEKLFGIEAQLSGNDEGIRLSLTFPGNLFNGNPPEIYVINGNNSGDLVLNQCKMTSTNSQDEIQQASETETGAAYSIQPDTEQEITKSSAEELLAEEKPETAAANESASQENAASSDETTVPSPAPDTPPETQPSGGSQSGQESAQGSSSSETTPASDNGSSSSQSGGSGGTTSQTNGNTTQETNSNTTSQATNSTTPQTASNTPSQADTASAQSASQAAAPTGTGSESTQTQTANPTGGSSNKPGQKPRESANTTNSNHNTPSNNGASNTGNSGQGTNTTASGSGNLRESQKASEKQSESESQAASESEEESQKASEKQSERESQKASESEEESQKASEKLSESESQKASEELSESEARAQTETESETETEAETETEIETEPEKPGPKHLLPIFNNMGMVQEIILIALLAALFGIFTLIKWVLAGQEKIRGTKGQGGSRMTDRPDDDDEGTL